MQTVQNQAECQGFCVLTISINHFSGLVVPPTSGGNRITNFERLFESGHFFGYSLTFFLLLSTYAYR